MIAALYSAMWSVLAQLLARPAVAQWLIERAMRTPYSPIVKHGELYMERFWLFNPYPDTGASGADASPWRFPISVRIHRIVLPDQDRDMHDHPWNARTIILRGVYIEERERRQCGMNNWTPTYRIARCAGQTARLDFGEYHRIRRVSEGGVWTLFITGRYRGTWGFLVNDVKVQWRKYLGIPEAIAPIPDHILPVVETDRPLRRRVILAIIATYLAAGVGACGLIYLLGEP